MNKSPKTMIEELFFGIYEVSQTLCHSIPSSLLSTQAFEAGEVEPTLFRGA